MKKLIVAMTLMTALSSCSLKKEIPSMEYRCTYDGNSTEVQCLRASDSDSEYCKKHKN
jgi:hypothetical protein